MSDPAPAFMIDSAGCVDRDDAVRLVRDEQDRPVLEVYVADVTTAVQASPTLLAAAIEKGASIYRRSALITPMLPPEVVEGAGLAEGAERHAVRVSVPLHAADMLGAARIDRAVVPSPLALSHQQVTLAVRDRSHEHHGALDELRAVAEGLFRSRYGAACAFYDLERGILLDEDGRLRRVGASRVIGHLIVQEAMILANRAVAEYAARHDVPVLYRNHVAALAAAPATEQLADLETALAQEDPGLLDGWLARADLVRRKARYDTYPRGHAGLGVSAYCHATSPLRRAADLLTQLALVAHLEHEPPPLAAEQLTAAAEQLTAVTAAAKAETEAGNRERRHALARQILADGADYAKQSPDRFSFLLKRAAKDDLSSAAFLAEVERRGRADLLAAMDEFYVLLLARGDGWAAARAAALSQLARHPADAVSLLAIYSVSFGTEQAEYRYAEHAAMAGREAYFSAVAELRRADGAQIAGTRRSAPTKKAAQQQAAVSLLAMLAGEPDPSGDQVIAPKVAAAARRQLRSKAGRLTAGDPSDALNHARQIGLLPGLTLAYEQGTDEDGQVCFHALMVTAASECRAAFGAPGALIEVRGRGASKRAARLDATTEMLALLGHADRAAG